MKKDDSKKGILLKDFTDDDQDIMILNLRHKPKTFSFDTTITAPITEKPKLAVASKLVIISISPQTAGFY